jgi:hypothetical protein
VRAAAGDPVKTKAVDGFYDDEAARLAANAARASDPSGRSAGIAVQPPAYIPPILLDEPQRTPLRPEPPINQNIDLDTRPRLRPSMPMDDADEADHPAFTIARLTAWILLAPLYLAMLAASVGVLVLFGKDLFGL